MSRIRLLSEAVCNRIAAGEVVERPASVVKELVENSLDAGATKITVSVEQGGQKLISVLDNGEGMDPDDAMLCLESHATSKIRDEGDIFTIHSFGFRGEAIPSIASVSRMTIRTRRRESSEGFEIAVHASKELSARPTGCAPGTEITVRDLFGNVPARRKFLKSAATEERHIVEVITNMALAHPHVAFELRLDGRASISSPSADTLAPRIRELFGKEFSDAMVPVARTESGIRITGFISRRSYTRPSRQEQRVFVNARPVESAAVYRGIREGCGPTLDKGRYQAAILFLSMPPRSVDVNVHPAKREVRFRNEFEVISAVRNAVTEALRLADPVIPCITGRMSGYGVTSPAAFPEEETGFPPKSAGNAGEKISGPETASSEPGAFSSSSAPSSFPGTASAGLAGKLFPDNAAGGCSIERILKTALVEYRVLSSLSSAGSASPSSSGQPDMPLFHASSAQGMAPSPNGGNGEGEETGPAAAVSAAPDSGKFPGADKLQILGLLEDSYIVGSIPGGLVLIDQHAAHERVLFEQILKRRDVSLSQRLLLPITLELSRAETAFVEKNAECFAKLGFEIEPFGQNTVKLNGIPPALPQDNAGGIFRDLLAGITDSGIAGRAEINQIARAACKAAVKAHDRLSLQEAEALIRAMADCEQPFSCPHGRPTVLNISLNEIERRFGRK